jgi:hypothetical protein
MKTFPTNSAANRAAIIAIALATLATASAAPAFATNYPRPLHMYAGDAFADDVPSGAPIDMKRAAAVHDCSVAASKFSNASWQTAQFAAYGTCMTEHGQIP